MTIGQGNLAEGEAEKTIKKWREKIGKLEKDKKNLLQEMEGLREKVGRVSLSFLQMTKKQICSMFLLGTILTSLIIFLPPVFIDPLVSGTMPLSTLESETELVSYLRVVQDYENIYIGVHGYEHKCPFCGAVDHELSCPGDHDTNSSNVPLEEVQRLIEGGVAIFNRCGLRADWYGFPGMAYDENVLSILKSKGFITFKYQMLGWRELDTVVSSSLTNFTVKHDHFRMKEYTWMWEDTVSEAQVQAALEDLTDDRPIQILMHIVDFTNQTRRLLKYAVLHGGTTLIRCDDLTSDNDLQKTRQLVEFAVEHNVDLLLCVIPASRKMTQPPLLGVILKVSWILCMGSFAFPIVVMIPWTLAFSLKRKKVKNRIQLLGKPHFPTVSLILPAYNEEKTIAKSIEQGLSQDYKGKIEVIVIDDGSTDRTFEIAKKFADEYGNVKVIRHGENRGKSYALNTGFAEAEGEISVFSDTDSILTPKTISKMIPHFKDPKVGMVAGMIIIENDKSLLTRLQQIEYLFTQLIVRFCQSSHKNVLICPGAATAVRTHIAQKIPVTDRTVTEDADFTFSVWKEGWKVTQEPEAISYTQAPENLKDLLKQRKRWLFGGLQVMANHKWALKKGNVWVIRAWLGCFLAPLTILSFFSIPVFYSYISSSFPIFLATYGSFPFIISCIILAFGIKLYNDGEKSKLAFLIPLYALYQVILNLLLVYLVFAFVSRRGIHLRFGGRIIHAT